MSAWPRLAGLFVLAPLLAAAQSGPPVFTAPPGSARGPVRAEAAPAIDSQRLGQDALDLFRRTCAAAPGDAAALVDRALAAGLQPYQGEGDSSASGLLGGAAGQVFAPPGRGAWLQLALAGDGRCTVWAQGAIGPALKAGFTSLVESLREPGASLRSTQERTVQLAGGWRQQTGYELRDARGVHGFDAVTLLSDQPGVQVLSSAALAGAPR